MFVAVSGINPFRPGTRLSLAFDWIFGLTLMLSTHHTPLEVGSHADIVLVRFFTRVFENIALSIDS